jgi:hypothetical protein
VESAVLALHVENEIDETGGPLSEAAIARITVKIEKEHDGAGRVVDACDTLEPPIPRR